MERLSGAELEAADEANKLVHLAWIERRAPGMTVREDAELVVVDSGLPSDTFNVVCRARLSSLSMASRVQQVADDFRRLARPFTWWVGPADRPRELGAALVEHGLLETGTEPGMVADLDALATADPAPGGLRVVRVVSKDQVSEFGRVLSELGSPPDGNVSRFYEGAAPVLSSPDCPLWLYLGYLGDRAVATAELTVGGGIVGLYNVATEEAFRRRGIGSAMTLRPLLDAREAGFGTAILQASEDGVRVYERLGFGVWGHFTEYHPVHVHREA